MTPLVQLILQSVPSIIGFIQQQHAAANPGLTPLTADQIHAAFVELFASSGLRDEFLRAALEAEIAGQPPTT